MSAWEFSVRAPCDNATSSNQYKSMNWKSDICVVGNGAIGKTAALGFAQAGLSVTLLTPPPAAPSVSATSSTGWDARVYALNQAARSLLQTLKVWDALDQARIENVDAMIVHGDGARAGTLDFNSYGARSEALAWIVEDRNLNHGLDAALKFAPNLRMVTGHASQLRATSETAVVELDNGDRLETSLLVGADGGQSWVRAKCDVSIDYRPYHQRAIVANFSCEAPHHGAAYQWFTSHEGVVALLPLPGRQVSLVWSAPDALADVLQNESLSQLAQRLTDFPGHKLGQMQPLQPETLKVLPLSLIRARHITALRTALVGDAAHVIHPLAGQGMNLGFADVAALLRVVAQREAHRDCGDARVLSRYSRMRKEDIFLMQLATDGLERLFATDFEPLSVARNIGLNLVDKLPGLKRGLIARAFGRVH
jgi:2-octaprenylphenol hydroxylase